MATEVKSTHIQVTLKCDLCGYEWDYEDYDANSVDDAKSNAEDEVCPECEEEMLKTSHPDYNPETDEIE